MSDKIDAMNNEGWITDNSIDTNNVDNSSIEQLFNETNVTVTLVLPDITPENKAAVIEVVEAAIAKANDNHINVDL